jgi:hypothetical protein
MTGRWCYIVSGEEHDENGYIPAIVHENEPGYSPLSGDGTQRPYYWGKTHAEASAVAEKVNLDQLGLSPADTGEIVLSSMRESRKLTRQVRDSR